MCCSPGVTPTEQRRRTEMPADSFRVYVMDQLREFGPVSTRSMFGGLALYHADAIFGIIYKERCYLMVDDPSRADYVDRGMPPFQPNSRQTSKRYYEVPP